MDDETRSRIIVALLFAIAFVLIGWSAPLIYASHAPQDHFLEVHNFSAEDTHVSADEHNIYLNRTVHRPADADIVVEMKLLRNDGTVVEQDSFQIDAYYQEGQRDLVIKREIRTDSLEPGTYRYVDAVTLSYYSGRVERTFTYKSEPFTVYENKSEVP